jgi:HD-like signal output (HDOD) protein
VNHVPDLDMLVNEIAELRPLPAVAMRVIEIAESDQFSAHELADAVSSDQALTAKLLRLSNSAYYGFPRRITTVRDAVVLLGFRAVRSATLATCVVDVMPGGHVLDPVQVWRHSMSVALLGEVLSRATRRHADEAFTAGMLHNIGRLALDQYRPTLLEASKRLAQQRGWTLAEAQQALLGFTDAELGGALALHWNFPAELATAVARHHLDVSDLPDRDSLAAFVVRARMYARASGIHDGFDVPSEEERPTSTREWHQPPVSESLQETGGIDGILQRVAAFVEHNGLVR